MGIANSSGTAADVPEFAEPLLKSDLNDACRESVRLTPSVDIGTCFCRRLSALLAVARPQGAVLLALLSIIEAVVLSHVGTLSSQFYQAFLDGTARDAAALLAAAAAAYAGAALLFAARSATRECLAWVWRCRLTAHLHALYCGAAAHDGAAAPAFYLLKVRLDALTLLTNLTALSAHTSGHPQDPSSLGGLLGTACNSCSCPCFAKHFVLTLA
jgi:hypothetical protein